MTKMTQEEIRRAQENVQRAQQAESLLENPIYQKIKAQMDERILTAFGEIPVTDTEKLYRLKLLHHSLQSMHQLFESAVREGSFDSKKLREALTH